jgi:hypothetical protein
MADPRSVSSLADLSEALAPSLEGMDASLQAETVAQLGTAFVEQSSTRRLDRSLTEARTYYVIHDTDLIMLRDVVAVALALIPKLNPLGTLPTLVGLLYRYRRKRARIDDRQAAVLLRLKAVPAGLTVEQLRQDLSPLNETMSAADVEAVLKSLQGVMLSNGESSDFVAVVGGVWRAVDV